MVLLRRIQFLNTRTKHAYILAICCIYTYSLLCVCAVSVYTNFNITLSWWSYWNVWKSIFIIKIFWNAYWKQTDFFYDCRFYTHEESSIVIRVLNLCNFNLKVMKSVTFHQAFQKYQMIFYERSWYQEKVIFLRLIRIP